MNLERDLLLWYTFDGANHTFVPDRSGNARHGRPAGGSAAGGTVAVVPRDDCNNRGDGPPAMAYRMRADNYLVVDHLPLASLDLGPRFTFALWIRTTDGPPRTWQTLLDNGMSGVYNPTYGLRLLSSADKGQTVAVDFHGHEGSVAHNFPGQGSNNPEAVALPVAAVPRAKWTHLAVVKNGTSVAMFIDAAQVHVEGLAGAPRCGKSGGGWDGVCPDEPIDPKTPRGPLWIGREAPDRGRGANGRFFTGDLDDVRIYNRSLAAAEVKDVYELRRCAAAVVERREVGKNQK